MTDKTTFSSGLVKHISDLAKMPITKGEESKFAKEFTIVIEVVSKLFKLKVKGIEPTSQVTGLENVFREDKVDEKNMLTQEKALSNAKKTYKGFFEVVQILEE